MLILLWVDKQKLVSWCFLCYTCLLSCGDQAGGFLERPCSVAEGAWGNPRRCSSRALLERGSVPPAPWEVTRSSPGCIFSGCSSAVHKDSACVFSGGVAENGSHRRTGEVSLLCITLPVMVVIHCISLFLNEIQVLFKTHLCFAGFKKATRMRWQWVFLQWLILLSDNFFQNQLG